MAIREFETTYYAMAQEDDKFDRFPGKEMAELFRAAKASRMLDIGCGAAGILSKVPADVTYEGLDVSEAAIMQARATWSGRQQTHFIVWGGGDLPFENNVFDIVVMYHSLEHFNEPQRMLREAVRVLQPHGRLILIGPNFESPFRYKGFLTAPYCLRHKSLLWRLHFMVHRIRNWWRRARGIFVFEILNENITDEKGIYEAGDDDLRHLTCAGEVIQYLNTNGMTLEKFYETPRIAQAALSWKTKFHTSEKNVVIHAIYFSRRVVKEWLRRAKSFVIRTIPGLHYFDQLLVASFVKKT
jgi:SAM-dependent methyltransferase